MNRMLLVLSLGMNFIYFHAYSERRRQYDKLAAAHTNLAYRTNHLLQQNGIEPDSVILDMLRELGVR